MKLDYLINLIVNGDKAKAEVQKVDDKLKQTNQQASKPMRVKMDPQQALQSIGSLKLALSGITAQFKMISASWKGMIDTFAYQERAMNKVAQGVKQTGEQAGYTAQQLFKMASELQKITTFGDEDILNKVIAQFLTFGNITGDVFRRAAEMALDLGSTLDGDIQGSAIQLAKALNDPTQGLTALTRSGVVFTKAEKELITSLWTAGEKAKAQGVILEALEQQYGGQARAAAQGAGIIKQAANDTGDAVEEMGRMMVDAISPFVKEYRELIQWFIDADEGTKRWIVTLVTVPPALAAIGIAAATLTVAIKALSQETAKATAGISIVAAIIATIAARYLVFAENADKAAAAQARLNKQLITDNNELEASLYRWEQRLKELNTEQIQQSLQAMEDKMHSLASRHIHDNGTLTEAQHAHNAAIVAAKKHLQLHIMLLQDELKLRAASEQRSKSELENAKIFWQTIDELNQAASMSELKRLETERAALSEQFRAFQGHTEERLELYKQVVAKDKEIADFKAQKAEEDKQRLETQTAAQAANFAARQAMQIDYAIKSATNDEQRILLEVDRERQAAILRAIEIKAGEEQISQIHAYYDELQHQRLNDLGETMRRNQIELTSLQVELGQKTSADLIANWDSLIAYLNITYGSDSARALKAANDKAKAIGRDGTRQFQKFEYTKQDAAKSTFGILSNGFSGMWNELLQIQTTSNNAIVRGFTSMANAAIAEIGRIIAKWAAFKLVSSFFGVGFLPFANGGLVPGFASGGLILGPGGPRDDAIPARVSAGEFIMPANRVAEPGMLQHLENIRTGHSRLMASTQANISRHYADGGLVSGNSSNSDLARELRRMTRKLDNLGVAVNFKVENQSKIEQVKDQQRANRRYNTVFR